MVSITHAARGTNTSADNSTWGRLLLHHCAMPLDACAQHLVHGLHPPVFGKNLDFRIADKPYGLYRTAERFDVDRAISHHAAIVENVLGWHQPVADVKRQQAIPARAGNLQRQLRVPPDMIDVECNAERAASIGIE